MMRISNKLSTVISLCLTLILLAALCVLAVWLPMVVDSMIDVTDNIGNRGEITNPERVFVLADAYVMVAVAFVAVILLFFLLRAVLLERIFTESATRLIASISWCCFAECLILLGGGVGFYKVFIIPRAFLVVAFVAAFLGIVLRVVKNVIEEATAIKSENDFTI